MQYFIHPCNFLWSSFLHSPLLSLQNDILFGLVVFLSRTPMIQQFLTYPLHLTDWLFSLPCVLETYRNDIYLSIFFTQMSSIRRWCIQKEVDSNFRSVPLLLTMATGETSILTRSFLSHVQKCNTIVYLSPALHSLTVDGNFDRWFYDLLSK